MIIIIITTTMITIIIISSSSSSNLMIIIIIRRIHGVFADGLPGEDSNHIIKYHMLLHYTR